MNKTNKEAAMTKVHLITGFLGTGKTTAILHLLKQKPSHEKWAVLVNEFGEVGIDGAIIKESGVAVREVPGGCLCCVSGLPFQMGLNMLLAREKPDVLLIEPTGLGHPRNVLQALKDENYQDVLTLGATVCLIDSRHLLETKYLENDVFVDQIQLADVLVANKVDLADAQTKAAFTALITSSQPEKSASAWIEQGQVDIDLLGSEVNAERLAIHPHAHQNNRKDNLTIVLPLGAHESYRRFENKGQGYFSVGWILKPQLLFSAEKLRDWVNGLSVERLKGIVCTDEGPLILNMREEVLSEMKTRELDESRLEIIDSVPLASSQLEQQVLACLASPLN
ncbi:MAG TPA: GTP-binding protein [Pseudomonadales bacterium]|nr:GTP-binding protein [Pseudomonadales bacterium]